MHKFVIFLIAFFGAFSIALSAAVISKEDLTSLNVHRDPKFILKVVSIRPEQCTTASTTNPYGTCFSSSACTNNGGTASGTCALGLGVCCILTQTCGSTIRRNGTSFVNEDNPGTTTTAQTCTTTINVVGNNICQLKLEFNNFEIKGPDVTGDCSEDVMTVTGTTNDDRVPEICGLNTGQHIYLHLDPATTTNPTISITTTGTDFAREWDISVLRIPCDSEFQAPDGCLQYFTESTGVVQSFNYEETTVANIAAGSDDVRIHLANLDYGVCINPQTDQCSITWTTSPTTSLVAFNTQGDASANSIALGDATLIDDTVECTDFVIIPDGLDDTGTTRDRYCGLAFPNSVTSTNMPFTLFVTTDGVETPGDTFNTGFSLAYTLNDC